MQKTLLSALILALLGALPGVGADLALQRSTLHQFEDGPNVGGTYEYLAGEVGWFSTRVAGYQREARGEEQGARLSWEIRITDPAGILIQEATTGKISETLRVEDKDWVPKISVQFSVPSFAPRGDYKIAVMVKDEVAGTQISGETPFRVRGEEIPAAGEFGIRNLRFLAREGDRFGMREAIYQRPGTLLAQFDIVNYKMEQGNRFAVEYQVALISPQTDQAPQGSIVYSQPEPRGESGQPFYPQRWAVGAFSLNFDKDVPVGKYTLLLTVRDKVAGSEREFREPFEIR